MAACAPGYRKPNAAERGFGRVLAFLVRRGLVRGHFHVLEVRGRKTGRLLSLPVDALDLNGRRFLVCARGETQWARNARAAGEITLVQGSERRRYHARELPVASRAPILQEYLDRFAAEVQRFFPVAKGSAEAAFADIAANYPVFELVPVDGAAEQDQQRMPR